VDWHLGQFITSSAIREAQSPLVYHYYAGLPDFYQGNKLIQGQVPIGNKRVDLGNIRIPILNIYAEQDHLVPL
jgi:poly(3-hydroxyalkanoate) synthetase